MMAEALGTFLGNPSTWQPALESPPYNVIRPVAGSPMAIFREAIRRSYDIQADNNALREGLTLEDDALWGKHFDDLRKNYPQRREFANYSVHASGDERTDTDLAAMGFVVVK
jgi:hypothetical protein